jgi:hypothetical protein
MFTLFAGPLAVKESFFPLRCHGHEARRKRNRRERNTYIAHSALRINLCLQMLENRLVDHCEARWLTYVDDWDGRIFRDDVDAVVTCKVTRQR